VLDFCLRISYFCGSFVMLLFDPIWYALDETRFTGGLVGLG